MDEYLDANRALWDSWTRINVNSRLYDVEGFAAGRGRDLDPIALAGPGDVRGKSLLHLQCHFGMDTIRWARHGAAVTGVDYFHGPEPIREEHGGCYAEPEAPITSVEHVWLHTMSEVIGSLVRTGLRIESFEEYPFLSWRFFPWMERQGDGWWHLPEHEGVPLGRGSLPLMFSLKASRDAR